MEIGVKTYRYLDVLRKMRGLFDYVEVMALDDTDYNSFSRLGVPIQIHMRHQNFGVNIADSCKLRENVRAAETAKRLADRFGSDVIVVHPGECEGDLCSFQNSVNFLRRFGDERFFVENMPAEKYLCNTSHSTKILLEDSGRNLCFDVNHAVEMARGEKVDEEYVVDGFFKLNPGYFHLGGQRGRRTHLSFSDSTLNLHKLLMKYPNDVRVTLEVSNNWGKTDKDLRLVGDMTGREVV
jgi:sugar phosphate isomerase/epimerase